MPSPMHSTKGGNRLPISKMTGSHLRNTILYQLRRANEGVEVFEGGGVDADDMWADSCFLYGADALGHMNHAAYLREAKKRGLSI